MLDFISFVTFILISFRVMSSVLELIASTITGGIVYVSSCITLVPSYMDSPRESPLSIGSCYVVIIKFIDSSHLNFDKTSENMFGILDQFIANQLWRYISGNQRK